MAELIKQAVPSVIAGIVMLVLGYFVIAKVNEANIENIKTQLKSVEKNVEALGNVPSMLTNIESKLEVVSGAVYDLDDDVSVTKLFVIKEHPESDDAWRLSAIKKLEGFSLEELQLLVDGLKYRMPDGLADLLTRDSEKLEKDKIAYDASDTASVTAPEYDETSVRLDELLRLAEQQLQDEGLALERNDQVHRVAGLWSYSSLSIIEVKEKQIEAAKKQLKFKDLVKNKGFSPKDLEDYARIIGQPLDTKRAKPAF